MSGVVGGGCNHKDVVTGGSSSSATCAGSRYVLQLLRPETPNDKDDNSNTRVDAAITRRLRGRPPGSKNKPKPPVIVARDSPNAFRYHVLEVASGADIVESVSSYARKRGRGVSVLSGSGAIAKVTFRQPAGTDVTLHGRFHILSLSGALLPPSAVGLSIFLSGAQGQVVGGSVVGPLLASGPVVLMAVSFSIAVYERLPLDNEEAVQVQPKASQSSGITASGQLGDGVGNTSGGRLALFKGRKDQISGDLRGRCLDFK